MTITKRISELLAALTKGIPERDYCLQLGFLSMIIGEPFFIFGRSGSGKSFFARQLIAAFKNPHLLSFGKRYQDLPQKLSNIDLIVFDGIKPDDEKIIENIHICLQDRENASIFFTSDTNPEACLSRIGISDKITMMLILADGLSSNAFHEILLSKNNDRYVPVGLTISMEEKSQWLAEIQKVSLTPAVVNVISQLAENCDKHDIYISVRKWLALTTIVKAIAFFNGRTETKITDTFFLGANIWGKSVANSAITTHYREVVLHELLSDIPEIINHPYDAENLIYRINHILNTSNNLYETSLFNNEQCVLYRLNIGGEPTTLYVPLRYVESDIDFHPFNELKQEEKRVLCNYHGSSNCTISIDTSVKGIGLRNSLDHTMQAKPSGKFNLFGTLPTYILKENDPEIIEQKKQLLTEIRQEIQNVAKQEAKNLQTLKDVFSSIKNSSNDLFCNQEFLMQMKEQVSTFFDNTQKIIEKIKEAHELAKG